jgi:hypothetical protein
LAAYVGFMRVLSKSGSHVRNQAWKNLAWAILSILVFGVAFLSILPKLLLLQFAILEYALLAVSLAALVAFYVYLRRYRGYLGGLEGEKHVAKLLKSALNDDYYLLNDVYFHDGFGDIDHIVLGPNGLFAIETKNWSGSITCHGDNWQRQSGRHMGGSPSRQVKKNATRIRNAIEASDRLGHLKVWVEGIVVFVNRAAELHLHEPTVQVLKLRELPNHISSHKINHSYSPRQLELMGKEILKQTR